MLLDLGELGPLQAVAGRGQGRSREAARELGRDPLHASGKPGSPGPSDLFRSRVVLHRWGNQGPWRDRGVSLHVTGRSRAGVRPGSPIALGLCVDISLMTVPGLWVERLSPLLRALGGQKGRLT